ncbi:hypothetical protein, partial [Bradyrhizobium sp.]|uniref:hypothetical protein n=1 Tax=Bradyrhizobium sp. TaxID=376 RepID=UPI003C25871D
LRTTSHEALQEAWYRVLANEGGQGGDGALALTGFDPPMLTGIDPPGRLPTLLNQRGSMRLRIVCASIRLDLRARAMHNFLTLNMRGNNFRWRAPTHRAAKTNYFRA